MRLRFLSSILCGIVALATILSGLNSARPSMAFAGVDTVRIAANLPLTGDLAIYGTAVRDGALLALEEARGRTPKISIDWQDNGGNPTTAVTVMQRQLRLRPDIYVSGLKPQFMAIRAQVQMSGTPHFVWIFDPSINQKSKNHFRTLANYKLEAPLFVEYARARMAKRVALVYLRLPHTEEEFSTLVIPKLRPYTEALQVEAYDLGAADYKTIAAKVKAFEPDLIVLNGFPFTLVALIRAFQPLGLLQKEGSVIATYDMIDAAAILGKDEIEGVRVVAPRFVTRASEKPVADWNARFQERFKRPAQFLAPYAYDMVRMVRDAATRVKPPASHAGWITALRETRIACLTGEPTCQFDEDGSLVTAVEIAVFKSGILVP